MADRSPDPLRHFLLGALSADEMDAIGARLVADDAFADQMADAEDQLIAGYLEDTLRDDERAAFERVYLATPRHRARVETVRALTARGNAATSAARPPGRAARVWLPAAAAVLLCTTGAWWLMSRGAPGVPVEPAGPAESAATRPGAPPAPAPDATASPAASEPPAAMPVVALTLTPLVTRGAGGQPAAQVPRGTAQVRLLLAGELPPADALTAEIAAVDRDEVRRWPVDDAPAGTPGAARAVTVPVYAVPAGDYILTVWQGDADMVQRYAFRILAP